MMRLCTQKSMPRSLSIEQEWEKEDDESVSVTGNGGSGLEIDYHQPTFYCSHRQKWRRRKSLGTLHLCLVLTLVLAVISPLILSTTAVGDTEEEDGKGEEATSRKSHAHCIRTANNSHNNNQTVNGTIKCVISGVLGHRNLTISRSILEQLVQNQDLTFKTGKKDKIHTLDVTCSSLIIQKDYASVNFTELSDFLSTLDTISITRCNLTKDGLEGSLPKRLRRLNLSNNNLNTLPDKLFIPREGQDNLSLSSINLSNNENLDSLPKSLLDLQSIEKVWLSQHNMSCPWVANHLFNWFERRVLMDADMSDCRLVENNIRRLTTYGALRAKHDGNVECKKTLPICSCRIYTVQYTDTLNSKTNFPVSFQSHGQNVSITLRVDCSGRNLTRLPRISPHTRFLNVSHNQITHLDELNNDEYKNLKTLVAEYNQIENIDSIVNTNFAGQFDAFGLSHNNISSLSHQVMSALLDIEVKGHGLISLGENYIDCDCDTARFLKLLLAKHQKRIEDAKRLFCRNWKERVKVQELEYTKVCKLDNENEHNIMWNIIIAVEFLLILMILFKVWHDHRQYRQTGILPFLSIQMPRLPCDTMLEGFKERPNGR